MGASLSVKAFYGKNSKEFKKHYSAIQFCIENELSFPKETQEFFKGKIDGGNLDDYKREYVIEYIKNGVEVDIEYEQPSYYEIRIKVSELPTVAEEIIIRLN